MNSPDTRTKTHGDLALIRRMVGEARPYWGRIFLLFTVGLLNAPLALLIPIPLKIAVDNIIGGQPLEGIYLAVIPAMWHDDNGLIIFVAILVVAIALTSQLLSVGQSFLRSFISERLMLDFRAKVLDQIFPALNRSVGSVIREIEEERLILVIVDHLNGPIGQIVR